MALRRYGRAPRGLGADVACRLGADAAYLNLGHANWDRRVMAALAPLPRLLALAAPLLRPGGVCLFPKGEQAEQEVEQASGAWRMRVERFPVPGRPGSAILRISELAHA